MTRRPMLFEVVRRPVPEDGIFRFPDGHTVRSACSTIEYVRIASDPNPFPQVDLRLLRRRGS